MRYLPLPFGSECWEPLSAKVLRSHQNNYLHDSSLADMAGCASLSVASHTSLQSRIAKSPIKAAVNVPFVGPRHPQTYRGYSSLDKACEAVLLHNLSAHLAD